LSRLLIKYSGVTTGDNNVEGKTYRIDTAIFSPQDVAAETTVVDGIGQRVALNIENLRGGGGQRRLSVFCPFWIVNATEHCLRYKQENGTSFVSGTVSAPDRDGSILLSGGRAHVNRERRPSDDSTETCRPMNEGTVFSGTPGALATSPGRCELPPEQVLSLLETDLPIDHLTKIAFMYNFNEGVLSMGHQKLCVQLWDGTGATQYASDWSAGFSLDSVGISHVVA
jgi:hypothetical protein